MTQHHTEKALQRELEILNRVIDQKILRGRPYTAESRRHKAVTASIASIRSARARTSGWLIRSMSFVSTFVL